jgi:hypothetical protein
MVPGTGTGSPEGVKYAWAYLLANEASNKYNPFNREGQINRALFGGEPPPKDICDLYPGACLGLVKAATGVVPGLNSLLTINDPNATTGQKAFAVATDVLAVVGVGMVAKFGKLAKGALATSRAASTVTRFATRALTAADLGLSGRGLAEVTGAVVDAGSTRIITVDMIRAVEEGAVPVGELRRALPRILEKARAEGVATLQIDASFANDALRDWAAQKTAELGGSFASAGGRETFTFVLGSP